MRRRKWRRKHRRPAVQPPKDWGQIELVSFVKAVDDREPNYCAEIDRRAREAKLPRWVFEVPGGQTAEQLAEQPDPPEFEWLGAKYFGPNVVRLLEAMEEERAAAAKARLDGQEGGDA